MIVFSGHIANWEIAMLAGIQHGISVAQIYRAGNNPLLGRMTRPIETVSYPRETREK